MKLKRMIIISIIISLLMSANVVTVSSDNSIDVDLSDKTFEELIYDMNALGENINMDYVLELDKRVKNVSIDRITEEILNQNNVVELRVLLLDLCDTDTTNLDYGVLRPLLFDEDEDFSVKYRILYGLAGERDIDTLVEIANGNEERLVFHALKALTWYDLPKAVEIVNSMIIDFNGPAEYRARAIVRVKSEELAVDGTQVEIEELIKFCDRLLFDEFEDDPIFVDTVVSELSDLHNKACIDYILKCDVMHFSLKQMAIHENYDLIGYIYGDNDSDNQVTAADALNVLKYSARLMEMNSYEEAVSELNWDDVINANDALLILQYSAKIIDEFPIMPKDYN